MRNKKRLSLIIFIGLFLILSIHIVQAGPIIESLSPPSASPGSSVTIHGSGFGENRGGIVLTGLRIEAALWLPTRVTFKMPQEAATGLLHLLDAQGTRSNKASMTVNRALHTGQFIPFGMGLMETGMLGASFLAETDGTHLYGILGFETLSTYKLNGNAPSTLCSRIYLPQRVGDLKVHNGYLFCAGDHGLSVYRCRDLQAGGTERIAGIAGGSFLSVDVKLKTGNPMAGVLVALCDYRPNNGSDALNLHLYAFENETLARLGTFTRPAAGAEERQMSVAIDPGHAKVYVSGYQTLLGNNRYLLEFDITDPARPALNHREETVGVLLFDMETRRDILWAGLSATGTETFRTYQLNPGAEPLTLSQQVMGKFQLGKTTRVKIIDDRVTVGSAWSGARPDVFLLSTFNSGTAPLAAVDSIDWAFDVTGFSETSDSGRIIVADEWAGFLTYGYHLYPDPVITHERDYRMILGAAMTEGLHLTDKRIFVADRGGGVWSMDRFDLADESAWKWVPWAWDEEDPQPHPISALSTRHDETYGTLIAALGHDKAMAWGTECMGLLYREDETQVTLLAASDPIDPPGLYSSGVSVVWPHQDIVFMTTGTDGIRAYLVDPRRPSITLHRDCQAEGFCRDVYSQSNLSMCMAHHHHDGMDRLIVGSKPGLFSPEPTLHVFEVSYPSGIPDRRHPDRPVVIRNNAALTFFKNNTVQHLTVHPSGMIAAATQLGLAVFHIDWIPALNSMTDFQAWQAVKINEASYAPWWHNGWPVAFADVAFGDEQTIYGVKAPEGVWKLSLAYDRHNHTHECRATAFYPGVHCGMNYNFMLASWGKPGIATLHHPYGVAADGDTAFVTGWSGKVQRLSDFTDNAPPAAAVIQAPQSAPQRTAVQFSVLLDDPDHDAMSYQVKWGDGQADHGQGLYPAGTVLNLRHTWRTPGNYRVRINLQDAQGLQGAWQAIPIEITVQRGDLNDDGTINLADALTLLAFLFMDGDLAVPPAEADMNHDDMLDLSDVVRLLLFLFP